MNKKFRLIASPPENATFLQPFLMILTDPSGRPSAESVKNKGFSVRRSDSQLLSGIDTVGIVKPVKGQNIPVGNTGELPGNIP